MGSDRTGLGRPDDRGLGVTTSDAGAVDATTPVDRSREPAAGDAGPNAADAKRATTVAARRVGAGTRRIALAVAAPVAPGSYRLDLEMRDVGGRPLPAAERVDIPSVEVRVWGDRAVSYDLEPSPDGDGAVVRITNTGRTTIPAMPHLPSASRDLEAEVAHSFVTVTASSSDGADPAPLPLITSPLVADLLPGATVSLDVTGIEAVTGRIDELAGGQPDRPGRLDLARAVFARRRLVLRCGLSASGPAGRSNQP